MFRLRQTNTVVRDVIKCTRYDSWDGSKWVSTLRYISNLGDVRSNGHIQAVYDWYVPRPARDFLVRKKYIRPKRRNLRKYLLGVMPPLNFVRMSKVEYPSTKEPVVYERNTSTERIRVEGPNAALLPFSYSANRPYFGTQFTQVDSKVYSYLLQRAYSRMSSAEYDFGVTIGEVAETAAFLAKPLSGIVTLSKAAFAGFAMIRSHGVKTYGRISAKATKRQIDRIKRTTFAHPLDSSLRILDESANHWLAYKFGVLPIIDDVKKVMEFKENNIQNLTGLRVARVRGKVTDETVCDLVKDWRFYGGWYLSWMLTKRTIDQHHCGLYFRNKVTAPIVNFVENLGFAPWQLPSLAWELIPLSFVVDRFIDIKSFIRGNVGSLTKETFGSFCTRKIETTYATTVHNFGLGDPSLILHPVNKNTASSSVMKYEQMERAVNLQRPNFPVVNPYWRDQLVADATNLALIWGRLRTNVSKFMEK